jgi:uncharacterized protein YmfQ (DUF2313 family)
MILSERAQRMMDTLPIYYHGNELVERAIQALANEFDRAEALAMRVRLGLVPATATDDLGMLGSWEAILKLPVEPVGATVVQRRQKVYARFRALATSSALDTYETLQAAAGGTPFTIHRNTPVKGQDTIELPFEPGSYTAAQMEEIASIIWPAHRQLFFQYSTGFVLDVARLDSEVL